MAFTSWRGVVGCIKPTMRPGSLEELVRMLPEGIGVLPLYLNIRQGTTDEFKRSVEPFEPLVAQLAEAKCDLIHPEGAPPFMLLGYKGEAELLKKWERKYKIPMFTSGTRKMWAAKPGLSKLTASGTVVAFSTRPGQTALDGDGALSVYTRHLTRVLRQASAVPVEEFFKRVRAGVVAETNHKQVPWESSDLNGELCFRPGANGQCVREP